MEQFKNTLKKNIGVSIILIIIVMCAFIVVTILPSPLKSPHIADFIKGYQSGLLVAIASVLLFHIFRYIKALKQSEYLKKIYIKNTDERERYIQQRSCSVAISITMFGLSFATVIAGFFNTVVFGTLAIATVFVLLAYVFSALYFSKKL